MNGRWIILVFFFTFAFLLTLTVCAEDGGDLVERIAEAVSDSGTTIAIPGYEKLTFSAGEKVQSVYFINPSGNACAFVLSLSLDDNETLWTGDTLFPGNAFTRITLSRALDKGSYPATLHYDCLSLQDNTPLNGAKVQLIIQVR